MGLAPPGMGGPFGGGGGGAGLFGNPFGAGAAGGANTGFPAPGQPSYAQPQQAAAQGQGQGADSTTAPSPTSNTGAGQQPNPFAAMASLFGGMQQGQTPGGGAGGFDPAMMSGLLGLGAGGASKSRLSPL